MAPNSGNKAQSIDRLFGGSAAAYASFDPATVIAQHGRYTNVTGWFSINSQAAAPQSTAANSLCALGSAAGAGAVRAGGREVAVRSRHAGRTHP